jgi:hypothetical protein
MKLADSIRRSSVEKIAHVAEIVGVLVGIISLWFVYAELRHQTRVSMAANAQSLVGATQDINLELAANPELAALWLKDYESASAEERARKDRIWIIYLNVLETAYYQNEDHLFEPHVYAGWDRDLVQNAKKLSQAWPRMRDKFSPAFAKHVDEQLTAGLFQ